MDTLSTLTHFTTESETIKLCLTFYQMTKFGFFQIERVADDNCKFDENARKSSYKVENTEGKGEIACYEQFLLFPQCFQKRLLLQTYENQGLFGKG